MRWFRCCWFHEPPIVCGGSVFGLCFVIYHLMSFLVLQSPWRWRESWLLYFNYLPDVLWLLVCYGSSSPCRGLVCSVWLWYFLIILTYVLKHSLFGNDSEPNLFIVRTKDYKNVLGIHQMATCHQAKRHSFQGIWLLKRSRTCFNYHIISE